MVITNHDCVGKAVCALVKTTLAGLPKPWRRELVMPRTESATSLSYNALVQSGPEIDRLARDRSLPAAEQTQLFEASNA